MLPQRVLLLGVNTGLGQRLAARLARDPAFDVLGADREAPEASPGGVPFVALGAKPFRTAPRLLLDFAPHAVVVLSRWHAAHRCEDAPASAYWHLEHTVGRLARRCFGLAIRLIVHSSDLVFGGRPGGYYSENDRPAPASAAGRQHLAAENAARGAGLHRWAIVRTGPLYATGDAEDPLGRDASHFETAHAALARPYTHADAAADGFERLLRRQAHGLYHIAGHDLLTPSAFAALALPADRPHPPPTPAAHATGLITLRAETELGWRSGPRLDVQEPRRG